MSSDTSLPRRLHAWGVQHPKWYYIYPPSAWAVFIYVISIVRVPDHQAIQPLFHIPGYDKLAHLIIYAVLSLLILRGWQREKMPPLDLHLIVFGLCVVFGGMIEIHQSLTPYRSFELMDLAADALGALVGQVSWHLLMLRWGKRTRLYPGLLRPDFKDHPSNRKRRRA